MHELRGLGPDFKLTHDDARRVELFQCGHDDAPLAPSACLSALVGAANAEHLWVCSQDAELRQRLNNIPGAPSLFMTVNGESERERLTPSRDLRTSLLFYIVLFDLILRPSFPYIQA